MDLQLLAIIVVSVLIAAVTIALVSRRGGPGGTQAPPAPPLQAPAEVVQEPPVTAVVSEAPTPTEAPVVEAPVVEEPPAPMPAPQVVEEALETLPEAAPAAEEPHPAPEPKVGLASRLRAGLQKTRGGLVLKLAALAGRDKLDDEAWEEIEEALIMADVGVKATTRIVEQLRKKGVGGADLRRALEDELTEMLSRGTSELNVSGSPSVWLVTGVNGVGKTTSIAKLGHRLVESGTSVVLAAADTFRAAAIDQLGTWAERAGVHMVKHAPGADPGAVVFDAIQHAKAKGIDVVIVDTAGRLHTKSNLMEELKKVHRIVEREAGGVAESLLVLDATVGQNGLSQAKTFQEAIDISGVILTKLDGTARGGIVVAIQEELKIPVKAVGVGETMDDLETFDPRAFVEALLEDV